MEAQLAKKEEAALPAIHKTREGWLMAALPARTLQFTWSVYWARWVVTHTPSLTRLSGERSRPRGWSKTKRWRWRWRRRRSTS